MNHAVRGLRPYRWWLVAVVAVAVAALAAGCAGSSSAQPDGTQVLTVERGTVGPAIPNGFVGLSMEYRGLETYTGLNPKAIDPVFEQLLRNLAAKPVLRIGGDGTDWTWYPVPQVPQPPGGKYSLNPQWLQIAKSLAQSVDGRLILGINLEADSRAVAAGEARAFTSGIGRQSIDALEIGNEPELYGSFSWYKNAAGQHVDGRPHGYDFTDYLHDFSSFAAALGGDTLAGPSSGGPEILSQLGSFLHHEPRVKLVTVHAYPLKHCSAPNHVSIGQLLSNTASAGLANTLAPLVGVARHHGAALRIDEINAVSCGGQRGVSDAFASSLWALNTLFELARIGVQGVNVHTVPGTINEIIGAQLVNGHWQADVHPEYYGMMMFAQAAPAGARLLKVTWGGGTQVQAWATKAPDGRVRVVLINRQSGRQTVDVKIPSGSGPATLERLQASSVQAESGVTIGGQSFGAESSTGLPTGPADTSSVSPVSGRYTVTLPAAGAAMLTLSSG